MTVASTAHGPESGQPRALLITSVAAHDGSSSRTTAGRISESFSSGTTTEMKMSRLIRLSVCSFDFFRRRRQRLVEVVDVVDLAAQNGDDIGGRRIALEQDRPAVVDPALGQDRLDLP